MTDWFADWADRYDANLGAMGEPEAVGRTVDVLAELAGDGAALELAVGTGRIALPLARRGIRVHGIDLSEPMVEQLRAKPGGDAVPVTIGDIATTRAEGSFRVVYLVYNTINNLTTQDAQVACFENAAAHLEPGGCFVVEVGVPDLQRLPPGERYVTFAVRDDYVGVDEYDVVEQGLISHHQSTGRRMSVPFRYVWPSELDLMARIAGLTLRERWEDWTRAPFTAASRSHVSVWEKSVS
jgi:SAM-dependent methyltransferase